MPYQLGGRVFPTKTALTEHVQKVREATPAGEAVTDSAVLDLLRKHPQWDKKTASGVGYPGCAYITFSSNLKASKEIAILFDDGRPAVDISWTKVVGRLQPDGDLRPVSKAQQHLTHLREAGRNDIREQLLPLYKEGHHVDHVFPKTFEVLLFQWVQGLGLKVTDIEIYDHVGVVELGKHIADPDLLASWQSFHKEHAVLEVVTTQENLSRPKVSLDWTPLL